MIDFYTLAELADSAEGVVIESFPLSRTRSVNLHLTRFRVANERKRDAARQVLVDGAKAAAMSMVVMSRGKRLPDQDLESSVARAAQRDALTIAGVEPPERIEAPGPGGRPPASAAATKPS